MYSQTAVSASRSPSAPFVSTIEQAPTLRDIFRGQPTETFAVGEALFWEGDEAGQIFDVLEGVLRVYRIMPDGRRAIMGFIHPGDVLGVSFQNRYLFTAEAVTEVKVRRFGRGRFFAMINETPALRPQLFAILCDEMSAAQDQMLLLGRKTAVERVASFLDGWGLRVASCQGGATRLDLPMTRNDLAEYLGLTVETISRALATLRKQAVVAVGADHVISVIDPARLAAIGQAEG